MTNQTRRPRSARTDDLLNTMTAQRDRDAVTIDNLRTRLSEADAVVCGLVKALRDIQANCKAKGYVYVAERCEEALENSVHPAQAARDAARMRRERALDKL